MSRDNFTPTSLDTLHLYTNHPYRCPRCRSHKTFLDPVHFPIPQCPECSTPLVEDTLYHLGQQELDRDACFPHTFTPEQAIEIIDSIPDDSFHWPAIAWNRVEEYADILTSGTWSEYGQHWHPVRFNSEGNLQTGAQRLLAVFISDWPMKCWVVDHSEQWFRKGQWVH